MRKKRRNEKLRPYLMGLLFGYAAMALAVLPAALILSLMKSASGASGAAAVLALTAGSFVCGKTAGNIRRKQGLKTGFLCGLAFCVPITVIGLFFPVDGGIAIPLKLALCAAFGAIGGVSGANMTDKL